MRQTPPIGVGVYTDGKTVSLLYRRGAKLFIDQSRDGLHFEPGGEVTLPDGTNISSVHIAKIKSRFSMAFVEKKAKKAKLRFATAARLTKWTSVGDAPYISEAGALVNDLDYQGHIILYFGGKKLGAAISKDGADWRVIGSDILPPPSSFATFAVGDARKMNDDILFLYFAVQNAAPRYRLFWATFSPHDPAGLRASADTPVWEAPDYWDGEPFGVTVYAGTIISYWNSAKKGIFALSHGPISAFVGVASKQWNILHRVAHNPILSPIVKHFWESKAVFNPAAVYSRGKVHLIYRAIGDRDVSVLGYANSGDGVHIDERLSDPVYTPREPFEQKKHEGYSGCEDPRLTLINERVYIFYTAYTGEGVPRVAVSSIARSDFLAHQWTWEAPTLISPPGIDDKNACVLSERIQKKFVILHRLGTCIWMDWVDSLRFPPDRFLSGTVLLEPRPTGWDSDKVGIGGPPIKTRDGWLLMYHGLSQTDHRYRLGAALLSEDAPLTVVKRLDAPILEPEMDYENTGVRPGTVFACGNVVIGKTLYVYYGGADQVCAVATIPLDGLLAAFK